MRKLRLHYAVPVYVLPKAPMLSLAGKRGRAHEFPWMMSPFRVGCAVEPSQLGQRQTAMHHQIVLIVFPSWNPTQGRGSRQMVLIHRKPPPRRGRITRPGSHQQQIATPHWRGGPMTRPGHERRECRQGPWPTYSGNGADQNLPLLARSRGTAPQTWCEKEPIP
jgi:hypothetical protein